MPDRPVLGIDVGALALGYDVPTSLSDDQLLNVKALYGDNEDNFRRFWSNSTELARLFRSGGLLASPCDLAQVARLRRLGLRVRFVQPSEGMLASLRGFAIAVRARNAPAAYAFLDCALSRPVQNMVARGGLTLAVRSDVETPSDARSAGKGRHRESACGRPSRPAARAIRHVDSGLGTGQEEGPWLMQLMEPPGAARGQGTEGSRLPKADSGHLPPSLSLRG